MNPKYLFGILLALSWLTAFAQNPTITIQKFESATPYTHLDLNKNASDFQFAVVTDRTGGHRPGVFMDGVRKLNLLQPEFVMSVGDLIEGYTEDKNTLNAEWAEFDAFVDSLEMPFFYVPGNHDITNEVMEKLWVEKFGATYYHFIYQDVLFLCLNSEDQKRGAGRGTISDEQYDYIKQTLEENAEVKWTLVFLHQPLWVQENTERWPEVEELLSSRRHNVFAGHYHHYVADDRNNGKYIMLATTGGGSALRGPQLGEFDHFMWVTMKETGPIIANIALNGVFDEDLFTAQSAEMVNAIEDMDVIQIQPPVVDDIDEFQSQKVSVKLTNDQDFPITVKLKERFNWDLIGRINKSEITINPNSVEFCELELQRRNSAKIESPFVLESTVIFTNKGTDIKIPGQHYIEPIEKRMLVKRKSKKVDGKLSDWDELRYSFNADQENGNQARFDMSYDDEHLYIAAKVLDNEVLNSGKGAPWTQDYIGFALNAETLTKSSMSKGKHWYAYELYFLISPENDKTPALVHPEDRLPEGFKFKAISSDSGYNMEAKIPLAYIESKQGKEWKSLRFNIMTGDRDRDQKEVMTFWQNNWRGNENIVGSGTFFRQ